MAEGGEYQKESVKCPICWDTFKRPRSLPCLHTFCHDCLAYHIANVEGTTFFSYFQCPVCRSTTRPPKAYSERGTWVEQFPINQWVEVLLEESRREEERILRACDIHTKHDLELYCTDHDRLCCAKCVATEHRQCQKVDEIDSLLKENDGESDLRMKMLGSIQGLKDSIKGLKHSRREESNTFASRREEQVKVIIEQKRMLLEHLRSLEQDLLKSMDDKYEDLSKHISTDVAWCSEAERLLDETSKKITSADSSQLSKFIALHKAKSVERKLTEEFSIRNRDLPVYDLILNEELDVIYERVSSLGEIKLSSTVEELGDIVRQEDHFGVVSPLAGPQTGGTQGPPSLESAVVEGTFVLFSTDASHMPTISEANKNVKRSFKMDLLHEKKCWITGIITIRDGRYLLVCDHSNASLKVFREDGQFMFDCKENSPPWCATKLAEVRAAVSYPEERVVRIFEVHFGEGMSPLSVIRKHTNQHISCTKKIALDAPCYGITLCGNQLVVCCEDTVRVVSLSGRTLQTIAYNSSGDSLFCKTIYATSNNQSNTCYISDEGNNSVTSFKMNRSEQKLQEQPGFVFKHEDLVSPRGLCVDAEGSILVADFGSKNIFRLSQTGRPLQKFQVEVRPWAMATNTAHRLYVTSYPDSDEQHHVYCYV